MTEASDYSFHVCPLLWTLGFGKTRICYLLNAQLYRLSNLSEDKHEIWTAPCTFFKSNLLVPAVHSLPCQSSSFKFYLTRDSRGPELCHWWIMFLNRGKGLRVGNSNSKKHLKLLLSYKKWGLNAPMMKVQDSKLMKPTVTVG